MARAATLSARLLRSELHPDTDQIHVRVYRGFWDNWDYIWQAPNALAADAADVGAISFQLRNGRWGLYGPSEITMANYTGPLGDFFYAVAYRPTDGLVLTAQNLGGPVNLGSRVDNYVRLQVPGGLYLSVYDNGGAGFTFGTTYWGELLYLGGYLDWESLPWAALLLDAAWAPDLNVQYLAQIPSTYWLAAAPLTGRTVLNDGRAVCDNTQFTVPTGRNMGHVVIFLNNGDAATSDIPRILTYNLAGKGVASGAVPVWLDFAGNPALWFGYGT